MTTTQKLPPVSDNILAALGIAEVTLSIEKGAFRNILEGEGCTKAMIEMPKGHPQVKVKDITWRNRTERGLFIRVGGASLRFKIVSLEEEVYFPLCLSFVRKSGGAKGDGVRGRLGILNFAQAKLCPSGETLDVTDHFKDGGAGDIYLFGVVIQRGSDGALGIIDPPIEHEDQ